MVRSTGEVTDARFNDSPEPESGIPSLGGEPLGYLHRGEMQEGEVMSVGSALAAGHGRSLLCVYRQQGYIHQLIVDMAVGDICR